MFCGITVWAFRGQQMNPNGVLERIQKAAQQDCVQGKNWEICWMDQWCVWYSQMLALTKQLTLISFIIYDMWVYTCASYRETESTSVKERACVRAKQLLHFPTDRETEQRKTRVHLITGELERQCDFKTKLSNIPLHTEPSHWEVIRWITVVSSMIIRGELLLMSFNKPQ